ncbi:MAG: 50S ribosomal protein L16 [Balneola sp.]|jgi:large subunit ribosomal protein L16|uniref:50S ribosomal protein L16 n=1 Tax=Balneola sp. EhC07 TaxID=1849360 RepID=UPI0007F34D0C|nr:50S ribosomal protein L16 [Balneola sp. EhC07]MBO6571668.1 50S ribosomal protein L16 [Balneola sp.]MBR9918956.1 50S ribosomal protein L16 [bacterium]MBO6623199.1 50S ribosomal protein L16 [Balneola sp.]MBO6652269.1 50S ribosomal protein L16 [Balneola sp.]MBO6712905.1 50S ribosomal protein L16 [Balneola sp.]|tara:strand:- start:10165 stop:10587 length:423 start_codon:yes stop_codon:yes gene_type:complete
MLEPKRVKRRRVHRAKLKGNANRGHQINFGDFALKAMEPKFITSRQIEACRIAIARSLQRDGQTFIRIFPDQPMTSKPAETRMGKGKGALDHWVAVVKPGRILFEIAGVTEERAREAMRRASHKLPIKTKFVVRRDYVGK